MQSLLIRLPAEPAFGDVADEADAGHEGEFGRFGHVGFRGVDPHEFHMDSATGEGVFVDHAGVRVPVVIRASVQGVSGGHAGAGHLGKDVSELDGVRRQDVGRVRSHRVLQVVRDGVALDRRIKDERHPPVSTR